MRALIPVVGQVIEALRAEFTNPDNVPLGGTVPAIEHRPGADIALDGLWSADCAGIVWANVIRIYRTNMFPSETDIAVPCNGSPVVSIQVGAARCVATVDDNGDPPPPHAMEHDALVGLDDATRLERALCAAVTACDDRDLIIQGTWTATDPIGPQGGALAWVKTLTVELAY